MSDDLLKAIILNLIVSLFSLLVDLKKIKHIFTNLSLFLTIAEESRHAVCRIDQNRQINKRLCQRKNICCRDKYHRGINGQKYKKIRNTKNQIATNSRSLD